MGRRRTDVLLGVPPACATAAGRRRLRPRRVVHHLEPGDQLPQVGRQPPPPAGLARRPGAARYWVDHVGLMAAVAERHPTPRLGRRARRPRVAALVPRGSDNTTPWRMQWAASHFLLSVVAAHYWPCRTGPFAFGCAVAIECCGLSHSRGRRRLAVCGGPSRSTRRCALLANRASLLAGSGGSARRLSPYASPMATQPSCSTQWQQRGARCKRTPRCVCGRSGRTRSRRFDLAAGDVVVAASVGAAPT